MLYMTNSINNSCAYNNGNGYNYSSGSGYNNGNIKKYNMRL